MKNLTREEMKYQNNFKECLTLDDRPYTKLSCGCIKYHAFTTGYKCPCGCGVWITGTHYSTWYDTKECIEGHND